MLDCVRSATLLEIDLALESIIERVYQWGEQSFPRARKIKWIDKIMKHRIRNPLEKKLDIMILVNGKSNRKLWCTSLHSKISTIF